MLLMHAYKEMQQLKKIAANASKQGKTDEQVKQIVSTYLTESKKKLNPNNEDLF